MPKNTVIESMNSEIIINVESLNDESFEISADGICAVCEGGITFAAMYIFYQHVL